jgi:CheY-like chemotaxis protein
MMSDGGEFVELLHVSAVAVIDDAFLALEWEQFGEADREAVSKLLLDEEVAAELEARGFARAEIGKAPAKALDMLTIPEAELGIGFQKIANVSADLARVLERRHTMRQVTHAMRTTTKCEVVEMGPNSTLEDISRFDIVFLDYYLDDTKSNGERAETIAAEIQRRKDAGRNQQIVLMSSVDSVRDLRAAFRKQAEIQGASFAFVAKNDLDKPWKVRAHLEMLSRAMPHAGALGDYIDGVKANVDLARKKLSEAIDDLDIGDFAYIQRVALHADGHPLGDYLSWLLSTHLMALAFEGGLREQQRAVDRMEFQDGPLSPAVPSIGVANLYHDALFARNLGALEAHPRATAASGYDDVPLVQLGDVFLNAERTKAVVVLSADCDLAFSTIEARAPDRNRGVILVNGRPTSIRSESAAQGSAHIEGMVSGADVYRIDWDFDTFRTVKLGELSKHLAEMGLDISNRDRLRPLYGLKLQQQFGANLMRVGPPVMPPFARPMRASIQRERSDGPVRVALDRNEVVAARFGDKLALRMTPSIVGKLYAECCELLITEEERLAGLPREGERAAKALRETTLKVGALRDQVTNDKLWISLVTDHLVPTPGDIRRLKGCVWLARGTGWSFPSPPAVVLALAEHDDPEADDAVLDPLPQLPTQTANIETKEEAAPAPDTQIEPVDPSAGGPQPKTKGNPRPPLG